MTFIDMRPTGVKMGAVGSIGVIMLLAKTFSSTWFYFKGWTGVWIESWSLEVGNSFLWWPLTVHFACAIFQSFVSLNGDFALIRFDSRLVQLHCCNSSLVHSCNANRCLNRCGTMSRCDVDLARGAAKSQWDNSNLIKVPIRATSAGTCSAKVLPVLWNSLPLEIKSLAAPFSWIA